MRRAALALGLSLLLVLALCGGAVRAQEELPQEGETAGEGAPEAGQVYFYLNGELSPVPRDIAAGGQTLEFAVMELLNGPSEEERAAGYVTYIPEGVKLQYSTIKQDRSEYSVNLSRDLLSLAGNREAAIKALAQLVKTVREAGDIPVVGVTVASEDLSGMPEDAFAALGATAQEVEAEISGVEPEGGNGGDGSGKGLVLLLALGIPALLILAAAAFYTARKRKRGDGEGDTYVRRGGAGKARPRAAQGGGKKGAARGGAKGKGR
ncbi:MAG: GerMN domain-containing protein [Actinobacteria bacterium]|nr:GerMN domain-containing protein [Actinomycetota bacterium]